MVVCLVRHHILSRNCGVAKNVCEAPHVNYDYSFRSSMGAIGTLNYDGGYFRIFCDLLYDPIRYCVGNNSGFPSDLPHNELWT